MTKTIFDKPTTSDIARKAQETFHRNADTLIAGYLIRNPDVNPEDVELVFQQTGGILRFSIEPKELHVPPAMDGSLKGWHEGPMPDYDFVEYCMYVDGWNDCRQAMIDKAKSVRAPEAMVSTLGAADV